MRGGKVAVIGGPDGPTAIFVSTTSAGTATLALLAAAVLAAAIWLFLRRRRR